MHILTLALLLPAAASCDRSITSSVLEASLEIVTPVVDDGGDFTARLWCNQSSFVVRSCECEFTDESVLRAGRSYSVDSDAGFHDFTFTSVTVKEDHNASVALTVYNDDTGTTQDLSAKFFCQVFDAGLDVLTPEVCAGDSLAFRVTSNHSSFTLVSRTCTASLSGDAEAGRSYACADGGRTFRMKVLSAGDSSEQTLTLVVHDPVVDVDKTLTGTFKIN